MARCRVKTNLPEVLAEFEEMAAAFEGKEGIRLRFYTEVEYFVFVEYGTVHMDARSMVRNSIEPIMAMFDELWELMPMPFFPDDLEALFELLKPFALEEILKRTPEITGDLKRGFGEGEVESY